MSSREDRHPLARHGVPRVGIDDVHGTHLCITVHLSPREGLTIDEAAARLLLVATRRETRPFGFESQPRQLPIDEAGGYVRLQGSTIGSGLVMLALPADMCSERESLSQLVTLLANGAEYNYVTEYWVEDFSIPDTPPWSIPSARYGVHGLRELYQVSRRPLIGYVIKTRRGIELAAISRMAREALRGGADFILDDLLLIDPDGPMSFESRVPVLANVAHEVASITGEPKGYMCNIDGSLRTLFDRLDFSIGAGVTGVQINGFGCGFPAMWAVAEVLDGRVPLVATNLGVGILTRSAVYRDRGQRNGFSEAVLAKLSRLAGADAVHTGTSASELFGGIDVRHALRSGLPKWPPAFAVAEGFVTVANLWENISALGNDVMIEATGGIANYPGGPAAGASAFRRLTEALDADMYPEEAREVILDVSRRDRTLREVLDDNGFRG